MNYSEWYQIAQQAGISEIEHAKPVSSSLFSSSWQLITPHGCSYWARNCLARHQALIECEVENLNALRQAGVNSPVVVAHGKTSKTAWLVCQWQPALQDIAYPTQVLTQLDQLHQHGSAHDGYGWAHNNDINGLLQSNQWLSDWGSFFRSQRLLPQLIKAKDNGLAQRFITTLEAKLAREYESCFEHHHPKPCLLHGNLYQSPPHTLPDAKAFFYHPACYYGDAEVDLAAYLLAQEVHPGSTGNDDKDEQEKQFKQSNERKARMLWYQLYFALVEFNLMTHQQSGLIEILLQRMESVCETS